MVSGPLTAGQADTAEAPVFETKGGAAAGELSSAYDAEHGGERRIDEDGRDLGR